MRSAPFFLYLRGFPPKITACRLWRMLARCDRSARAIRRRFDPATAVELVPAQGAENDAPSAARPAALPGRRKRRSRLLLHPAADGSGAAAHPRPRGGARRARSGRGGAGLALRRRLGRGERLRVRRTLAGRAPAVFEVERHHPPSSASCDVEFQRGARTWVVLYAPQMRGRSDPLPGLRSCTGYMLADAAFRPSSRPDAAAAVGRNDGLFRRSELEQPSALAVLEQIDRAARPLLDLADALAHVPALGLAGAWRRRRRPGSGPCSTGRRRGSRRASRGRRSPNRRSCRRAR